MATFTSRTIVSTRYEWEVPAAMPWGADSGEISKAWKAAEAAYRKHYSLDEAEALPATALWFYAGDDAVVIAFTVEGAR